MAPPHPPHHPTLITHPTHPTHHSHPYHRHHPHPHRIRWRAQRVRSRPAWRRGSCAQSRWSGPTDPACTPHVHVHYTAPAHAHALRMHLLTVCALHAHRGTPHAHRVHRTHQIGGGGPLQFPGYHPRWTRRSSQRRFTPRAEASPPTPTFSSVRAVGAHGLTLALTQPLP